MNHQKIAQLINDPDFKIQYKREKCRRSFFFFVKEFWDVIIKEQPIYNWHILLIEP